VPQGSRTRASELAAVTTRRSTTGARPPSEPRPAPTHPAARLRALGLRARKRLSQSFLADDAIARAIVAAADTDPSRDVVLEVGPGLGVLTERLVGRARRVVAVEVDPILAEWLDTELQTPTLEVRVADILRVDPAQFFTEPYVVVANLPYHITSPAIRHLLQAGPPYARRLVVMVQREVADRIAAPPGKLSALGVTIQAQAEPRPVRVVPASAFYPRPEVDSAVVLLEPFPDEERPVARADLELFAAFVHAGFAQPRKQIANSLAQGLGEDKAKLAAWLASQGVDPGRRPQELTVAEWAALFAQRSSNAD
jgi:16S rRNA (adenine1518-N6/adenine1519-N6)-dimethyltransferase